MMASLSKGSASFTNEMTGNNNNNNENDYEEDSFDEDSDEEDDDEEEGEERALSETGTYVLDKEEEEKQKVGTAMVTGDKVAMVLIISTNSQRLSSWVNNKC